MALQPDFPAALFNMSGVLRALGRLDEVRESLRPADALSPGHPDIPPAWSELGGQFQVQGRLDEAMACYRRALELKPAFPEAASNLGGALQMLGELGEAQAWVQRALELRPDYPDALYNLGYVLQGQGKFEAAIDCYDRVLCARRGHGEALWGRALSLLAMGDFARGWRDYEARYTARLVKPVTVRPDFAFPMWRGEPLSGKRILGVSEQGYGDQIQFVRYAALLARQAAAVDILADEPVHRLFRSVDGVRRVVAGTARDSKEYDCWALMLSLPLRLGTVVETIPREVPYLQPSRDDVRKWARRLSDLPQGRLKVGLVWSGKPGYGLDRFRSMTLSTLAPLGRVPNVSLVSLQTGAAAEEARHAAPDFPLPDLAVDMGDFADTAALLTNLDLLIAVDTAFAHLAGALARPVWLLQSARPDWRWIHGREDSPWYPTMKITRQAQLGEWQPVIKRVSLELANLARQA